MRIAITTGVLQIPPTYFVVNHAEQLHDVHEFEVFTLAANICDSSLRTPVHDFFPLRRMAFSRRMKLGPLVTSLVAPAIRRFRPDIVHQHFATWSGPAIAAAGTTVPLITTVHGYDVLLARHRPRTLLERWQLRDIRNSQNHSTLVLAVSEYLADQAVKAGFETRRLQVHYQGVDTAFFTPPPAAPTGIPTVVFVGGLVERKGIRDLVTASCELIGSLEHRLVIIGSGPLEAELAAQAATHPHIRLLGSVDRTAVREQLRAATVMVLPTQEHEGWREAAGLVLVEAQACGTPVIAYDSGGTSEMLDPGRSGLLVPEKDVDALRTAVRDILTLGSDDYLRMREAARRFAADERSLERSCAELLDHYETVAAPRAS